MFEISNQVLYLHGGTQNTHKAMCPYPLWGNLNLTAGK